jgi:hypothetical protein
MEKITNQLNYARSSKQIKCCLHDDDHIVNELLLKCEGNPCKNSWLNPWLNPWLNLF